MNKWEVGHLKNSKFPEHCAKIGSGSMSLLQGFIQDITIEQHPCEHEYSEPCENILKGTCLIVFPNSTLRVVIYPKYENHTIYFISCRD